VTEYTNLHFSLSKLYKKTIISPFPADPCLEPHGPPGVRGPQFGKRWHTVLSVKRLFKVSPTKYVTNCVHLFLCGTKMSWSVVSHW